MKPEAALFLVYGALVVQRLLELRLARRNEAWALERGAREYGADHYWMFFPLHMGWMVAGLVEAWWRGPELSSHAGIWVAVIMGAQVLRYWAIATLGRRWNTRVLVIPDEAPVVRGPYRFLRHPNYLAVVLELLAIPLLFNAYWTAVSATLLNAHLLHHHRLPTENSAWGRF